VNAVVRGSVSIRISCRLCGVAVVPERKRERLDAASSSAQAERVYIAVGMCADEVDQLPSERHTLQAARGRAGAAPGIQRLLAGPRRVRRTSEDWIGYPFLELCVGAFR